MKQEILKQYYSIIKSKIRNMHFETAMHNIDKLLTYFPNNEHGYYYKGICEFALNRPQNAIKCYLTVVQLNPAHGKAYFNLGVSYYMIRKYDPALISIAKALLIFTKKKELDKKQRCINALNLIKKERGV